MNYPDFDLSQVRVLTEIVRNGEIVSRRQEFGKAGWLTQGSIQKVVLGEPGSAAAQTVADPPAELLELEKERVGATSTAAIQINWGELLKWMLELLLKNLLP